MSGRGRAPGFIAANRKLTDEQVAEIRARCSRKELSMRRAALEYDVNVKTINGIMSGRLYAKPAKRRHTMPHKLPKFELVEVRPLPTAFESTAGRSYALAPSRSVA